MWAAEREGEPVAVKVLRVRPGSSQAEAIRRELRIGPLIDGHRGVVAIRRVEVFGNSLCLEMDWVRGLSLDQVLARRTDLGGAGLPPRVAVQWVADILETLDWVGRRVAPTNPRSFAHRDIKPSNLIIDRTGVIRITDFGIARAEARLGFQVTQAGVLKGSPRFMAPEALDGRRDVDARADQFSCGAVLFELLTGRPLYDGRDLDEIIAMAQSARVGPRLRGLSVPPSLLNVMRRLLSRMPQDRFRSHRDAATALHALELTGPPARELLPDLLDAIAFPSADDGASTEPVFEPADDAETDIGEEHFRPMDRPLHLSRDLDPPSEPDPTDEIARRDLSDDLVPDDFLDEDASPTIVQMAPTSPAPSTIGGWLERSSVRRRPVSDLPANIDAPEGSLGGFLKQDEPELTLGSYLQEEVSAPELTLGADLIPERPPPGAQIELMEPDDSAEYTVGAFLQPDHERPFDPTFRQPDLSDNSTANHRIPRNFTDEEATAVVPAMAYSDVLPRSMAPRQRKPRSIVWWIVGGVAAAVLAFGLGAAFVLAIVGVIWRVG